MYSTWTPILFSLAMMIKHIRTVKLCREAFGSCCLCYVPMQACYCTVHMVGSGSKHCRVKHMYCICDVSLLHVHLLELMHSDTLWLTIQRPSYSDKSAGLRFWTTCKLQEDGGLWCSFKLQDFLVKKPRSTGNILWFWLNDNKAVDGAWHHCRLLCVQQSFFYFKDPVFKILN